jgi:hypothetical protein
LEFCGSHIPIGPKKKFCSEKITKILGKIVRSGSVKIRSVNSGWEFDMVSETDPMECLEIFLAETKIQNFQKCQINFFLDRISVELRVTVCLGSCPQIISWVVISRKFIQEFLAKSLALQ